MIAHKPVACAEFLFVKLAVSMQMNMHKAPPKRWR
jgi:hypothetical protein